MPSWYLALLIPGWLGWTQSSAEILQSDVKVSYLSPSNFSFLLSAQQISQGEHWTWYGQTSYSDPSSFVYTQE